MVIIAGYLHLLMAALVLIADVAFFKSYAQSRNKRVLKYAIFFIPIFFYTFVWGAAAVFQPHDALFMTYSFAVGTAFVVMILMLGLYAAPFEIHPALNRLKWPLIIATGVLGAYFTYLIALDTRNPPIIDPTGFIFWNAPAVAAWGMGFLCLFATWIWAHLYYYGAQVAEITNSYARLKVIALAADGVMWGIAALIYYIPPIPGFGVTQLVLAFFLMIISLAYTALIYWLPARRARRVPQEGNL